MVIFQRIFLLFSASFSEEEKKIMKNIDKNYSKKGKAVIFFESFLQFAGLKVIIENV